MGKVLDPELLDFTFPHEQSSAEALVPSDEAIDQSLADFFRTLEMNGDGDTIPPPKPKVNAQGDARQKFELQ